MPSMYAGCDSVIGELASVKETLGMKVSTTFRKILGYFIKEELIIV